MTSARFPDRRGESGPAPEDAREETIAQRADRNLHELIQELRVVGLGVQVLFGFLLSLPFTTRFGRLSGTQQGFYLTSLVLDAAAITLLIGPAAFHRLVFRRGMKEDLVRFANLAAILGLLFFTGAVLVAVLLVTSYVAGWLAGALITALLACVLSGLWFAAPLSRRNEDQ